MTYRLSASDIMCGATATTSKAGLWAKLQGMFLLATALVKERDEARYHYQGAYLAVSKANGAIASLKHELAVSNQEIEELLQEKPAKRKPKARKK